MLLNNDNGRIAIPEINLPDDNRMVNPNADIGTIENPMTLNSPINTINIKGQNFNVGMTVQQWTQATDWVDVSSTFLRNPDRFVITYPNSLPQGIYGYRIFYNNYTSDPMFIQVVNDNSLNPIIDQITTTPIIDAR